MTGQAASRGGPRLIGARPMAPQNRGPAGVWVPGRPLRRDRGSPSLRSVGACRGGLHAADASFTRDPTTARHRQHPASLLALDATADVEVGDRRPDGVLTVAISKRRGRLCTSALCAWMPMRAVQWPPSAAASDLSPHATARAWAQRTLAARVQRTCHAGGSM